VKREISPNAPKNQRCLVRLEENNGASLWPVKD
jgi:hypothetical protein